MNEQQIKEFLKNLPDEKTRDYELSITRAIGSYSGGDSKHLSELLESLVADNQEEHIAYNAFYSLNVLYRRKKDFFLLQDLFDVYGNRFSKHITFDHLKALFDIESDSLYDYTQLLNNTYKDSQFFSDNAGFVHLFADVFASIYERGGIKDVDAFLQEWYEPALTAVNNAIALDPLYAKYYCTKARILSISRQYQEAIQLVNQAIALEDSNRNDYALRISNYQYFKMLIKMNERVDSINSKMKNKTSRTASVNEPTSYTGSDPYAFISYSHRDSEEVLKVLSLLEENGIRFWYDNGIPGGYDYADYIGEKVAGAKAFILLVSSNSMNSEFVRKEINLASYYHLTPFVVFISETTLSPGMLLRLNMYERINWYKMDEKSFLDKVLPGLKERLS